MFQKIAFSLPQGDKAQLLEELEQRGIAPLDCGAIDPAADPEALRSARAVAGHVSDAAGIGGILVGPWGLEGSMIGNTFRGVRASMVTSETTAMYTRCHNASNMLCLGAGLLGSEKRMAAIRRWLDSEFEGGRHAISVGMIRAGEEQQFAPGARCLPARPAAWPAGRVWVGCDHAGYEAKAQVLDFLRRRGIAAEDIGTDSTQIVRYPYYAARVAHAITEGQADMGILLCGTGIGMSIAAGHFAGIRAALCGDVTTARAARQQFDANCLCIGGKIIGSFELEELLAAWFDTPARAGAQAPGAIAAAEQANGLGLTGWAPESKV